MPDTDARDLHHLFLSGLSRNVLTPAITRSVFRQVVAALRALLQKGYGHRDIKPSNIIYNIESGTAQIIDLGMA